MLFHIIKKDFLLIKKYILFMLLVSMGIPLFVYMRIGERLGALSGTIAFIMQLIFTQFLINNSLSLVETKFESSFQTIYSRSIAGKSAICRGINMKKHKFFYVRPHILEVY